ncbi:ATP-dependent nuclease [Aedoeadaptatus coxii]|nr:AAA family ATPase [Peptoniphilus coxii]
MNRIESPSIHIKSIEFKDGTSLELNPNSIVVFTGANNCGKSQILRDIEALIKERGADTVVTSKLDLEFKGELDQSYFHSKASRDEEGRYFLSGRVASYEELKEDWGNRDLCNMHKMFVSRLDTEERLTSSKTKKLYGGKSYEEINSINQVYGDNSLENRISELFNEGFNQDLIVNRRYGGNVALHVGTRPEWEGGRDGESKYYAAVNDLPLLDTQGDGMRSFASIILDAFTSNFPITLIDEPEAFLHPPQARIIGKMLGEHKIKDHQLFISTHSAEVINGLLDSNNGNINVIRINREANINHIFCLGNQEIKELWSNPIFRYSNIFDGLFHKKVVVCESDYDCLFYKAMFDAISKNNHTPGLDVMFTHCGGKARMKNVVSALRALKVPVVAIPDFDIIDNKNELTQLCKAFTITIPELDEKLKIIYDFINADGGKVRKLIKDSGCHVLQGDAFRAYRDLENIFMKEGLFIVPVGELESFNKLINKDKKDWVYAVLEKENLCEDENLSEARKFIQKIIEF